MMILFLLVALVSLGATVSTARSITPWTEDAQLKAQTLSQVPVTVPVYSVDLDTPPEKRWVDIATIYKEKGAAQVIYDYLADNIPSYLLPILEPVAADLIGYFGEERAAEIQSVADVLGAPLEVGHLVALNLVMQLEHIGVNCTNWNVTGPTVKDDPGCVVLDRTQAWCYCHDHPLETVFPPPSRYAVPSGKIMYQDDNRPGMCTSMVATRDDDVVYHGRNLDWNVPPEVRTVVFDVDFKRGDTTLARATTAIGYMGVLNGMKPGKYSASIDARRRGGKLIVNFLEALVHHALTPSQHLRAVLTNENVTDYHDAIDALSSTDLIDDCYFIVGGVKPGEGTVIARDRNDVHDVWSMEDNDSWWVLQTNYDRENPTPVADNRRDPGNANTESMGQAGIQVNGTGLFDHVMSVWPTFNQHTDYTAIMSAGENVYSSYVWMEDDEALAVQ